MTHYKLTDDQSAALKGINAFLQSTERMATLSGIAGTGKTYLIQPIIENNRHLCVTPTAITNKATAVIRGFVEAYGLGGECYTTAKALNIMVLNDDEEHYGARRHGPNYILDRTDLLIIDEASMMGESAFAILQDAMEEYKRFKVLFVGDPCQLQPVKDGKHLPMYKKYVPTRWELKQIVRQSDGNPMIEQGVYLRKLIRGKREHFKVMYGEHDGKGIYKLDPEAFTSQMIKDMLDKGAALVRGLTFTCAGAENLSNMVRVKRYGAAATKGWQTGERVMNLRHAKCGGITLHSSQEATVQEVLPETRHPEWPEFRVIPITLETDKGFVMTAYETASDWKAVLSRLKILANEAKAAGNEGDDSKRRSKWRIFWSLNDSYVQLVSAYVCTIHRAQGSTYDTVYVDFEDVMSCHTEKENRMHRLMYVALTRPRVAAYVKDW